MLREIHLSADVVSDTLRNALFRGRVVFEALVDQSQISPWKTYINTTDKRQYYKILPIHSYLTGLKSQTDTAAVERPPVRLCALCTELERFCARRLFPCSSVRNLNSGGKLPKSSP